jgi:hypothetical protein
VGNQNGSYKVMGHTFSNMTLEQYTKLYKQEAAQIEMQIANIRRDEWSESAVLALLQGASNDAIQHLAVEHWKFAGIFTTAGHQIAEWCSQELNRRRQSPDYKLTVSEMMFGKFTGREA